MTQEHTFTKGDRVTIINQTFSGKFILEGEAEILSPISDTSERYSVRFGFGRSADVVTRYVDPGAQDNPQDFIDRLNDTA